MLKKSYQLCKFYLRSKKCKFGENCRFLHENTEQSCDDSSDQSHKTELQAAAISTPHSSEKLSDVVDKSHKNEGLSSPSSASHPSSSSTSRKNKQRICSFFIKHNYCAFGRNCRFSHQNPDKEDDSKLLDSDQLENPSATVNFALADDSSRYDSQNKKPENQVEYQNKRKDVEETATLQVDEEAQNPQESKEKETKAPKPKTKRKLCRYFRNGHCKAGGRCRFWHPVDVMEDLTAEFDGSAQMTKTDPEVAKKNGEEKVEISKPPPKSFTSRAPVRPPNQKISLSRDTASDEEIDKFRRTEINQLIKRFPRDRCSVIQDNADGFQGRFKFTPSDPDWPFDVKRFELLFSIPECYPEQMMTISLPVDQDLPETVRRYVELTVADWVVEKGEQLEEAGVFEIVFRPFLRWLDRNLETHVTEGLKQMKREIIAKAAGFEFIKASDLQSKYKASVDEQTADEESGEEDEDEEGEDNSDTSDEDSHAESDQPTNSPLDPDTEKKGTEVSLRHLQLKEGAATLRFDIIRLIIQCSRCKTRTDFVTPQKRINSIMCSKCNATQLVTFRPVLLHQFSSVMGYLDLEGCIAFDLILQESMATAGCMNCSKESKIDGLSPGQPLNTWCRHCHQKMMIATEAVKFAQLQPSGIETDAKEVHKVSTRRRVQKDPAIQEGKPLPEYGACKHYKKSYRWFRFPCCGMVYPCDICHEERGDGHEMVFANRVICGFCCKEQAYSPDKPCIGCSQMLTRSRSSHWEGGLGCRNKIKMGKNDSQKYKNSNKTISKHAQKLKDNSKKRTKLRHA